METGFTFWMGGRDYFYPATAKSRTIQLAKTILQAAGFPPTDGNARYIRDRMRPAVLETKMVKGNPWYVITGSNFGIMSPANEVEVIAV